MKAALRDAKRKEARARRQKLLEGEPGALFTKEERQKIWEQLKARGASDANALYALERIVHQVETQRREAKRLVQPVTSGLIVPQGRMIITPDEARQQAMPQ